MNLSKKAEKIQASITLAITAKAKQMKSEGIDVVGFGAGEPDFNTPQYIQEAALDAIKNGFTKYTPAAGIADLRQEIANKFKKDNNLNYEIDQIIVSTGAKQCISNVLSAILNPGDEVLIAVPYWVSYPELVKLADGTPVFVSTKEENGFKYTIENLEKSVTNKTKAIIINSPNNPTGSVYTKKELSNIAEFAKRKDIIIISDEIYEKLIYNNNLHISIASISEDAYNRTIVINGMSKTYAMTGWRLGYAAGNSKIIKLMSNIQSHTTGNANSISQYASLCALKHDSSDIESMIREFDNRRKYMISRIENIEEITAVKPQGAFYVMVNISKLFGKKVDGVEINDSLGFSSELLKKEKVAVIPGSGFGVDNYIRLSYATSMKNINEGLNRIEKFINSIN
ncbi:pyridoxal phosphate-dependent aminotransferase [Clostridium tyrobutyricum]|uniref:pyridoxal phosphate-dependent aminotransferase n=1 Tax=Clostridium tyrobutyricum TaxID=1519 RepID=UPI001C394C86|nr:pyridoxal phosphate-dependent aminotransferase [Clostridium tyrobutyricum]MBV4418104.1 pyridoxal phosphate-dependent aminotransferase [Clostridium tyrobutyricum]